jgi:hypothetical protein
MTPDRIVQTAHGLYVREAGVWYLVRGVEGTAVAPVVVLSGPVTFEVRTEPVRVDD